VLPIVLNPRSVRVGIVGSGDGLKRRSELLAEAGINPVVVALESSDAVLHCLSVLFVAGLDRDVSENLARRARAGGVLVNVEDVPEFCDFHVPAIVRRGELVLTASTGGSAPGLARRLREWLEERFGQEWGERLRRLGTARLNWRTVGATPHEVSRLTRDMVDREGWLQ